MTTLISHLDILAYLVVFGLLTVYVLLDGFDIGIGILQYFSTNLDDRQTLQASIAPVWNGNEVWLVTAGGALFAAFPSVYATFCSSFYLPVIVLLFGFIFRGICLEARESFSTHLWKKGCDIALFIASCLLALIFGVALGNLLQGIALDTAGDFTGSLVDLVNPFAILIGCLSISLFALHGALYSQMKTAQPLSNTISKWIRSLTSFFVVIYVFSLISIIAFQPHLVTAIVDRPFVWIAGVANLASVAGLLVYSTKENNARAFTTSCLTIISSLALYMSLTFPNLIRSLHDEGERSLTVFNASSSPEALKILLLYILIGIPCVAAYSWYVYRVFRRKEEKIKK